MSQRSGDPDLSGNHPSPPEKMNARRRRASTYITPRFHRPATPAGPDQWPTTQKTRNKPNFSLRATPKMRNKPNPTNPTAKKHETNPISAPAIMRNKPNSRIPGVLPPRLPHEKRETKPIPAAPDLWRPKKTKQTQSHPHGAPIMQNEPNSTPACHPERRAAERSVAAQRRGTCLNTIAEGDSKQKTNKEPKTKNKPNPDTPGDHDSPTLNVLQEYELRKMTPPPKTKNKPNSHLTSISEITYNGSRRAKAKQPFAPTDGKPPKIPAKD